MKSYILIILLLVVANSRYLMSYDPTSHQNKVHVQFFYQSLCPYCQRFIADQMSDLLDKQDLWDIVQLRMYPFGNAKLNKFGNSYIFECQHRQQECRGNMIMNCALDSYDLRQKAFPFIVCLQGSSHNWDVDGQMCAQSLNMNWDQINQCSQSIQGKQSMFKVGLVTQYTGIQGVPHVVIDGIQNSDAIGDFTKQICKAYKGYQFIKSCRQ